MSKIPDVFGTSELRVFLVGCGKSKGDVGTRAMELYTGSLFRAASDYAQKRAPLSWWVLSAKYGMIDCERCIEPYEQRLPADRAARGEWAKGVRREFLMQYSPALRSLRPIVVEILAGEAYAGPVCAELSKLGVEIEQPLRGLGLGQRLAWFKAERQE